MAAMQQFLSWWGAQLRGLLPARLTHSDLYADAVIADCRPNEPGADFFERRRRRETSLLSVQAAKAAASARRVLLRLPGGAVLERKLRLPIATLPELDRVLTYELDRISPFSPGELAWTYAAEPRDGGRIEVVVAMLPRAALVPALATLREAGVTPSAALAPRADGGMWRISLLASDHAARSPASRRALRAGAFACGVLALVAVALPFVLQERALARTEAEIGALAPSIAAAQSLRQRIAERAAGRNAVAAETARTGNVLNTLATLTALLPDDTYLTALTLRQRALAMTGRSASAARLIPLLEADPALRDPGFAAPVTRIAGADIFQIKAEIRP